MDLDTKKAVNVQGDLVLVWGMIRIVTGIAGRRVGIRLL
jgi:hypothetical protein